MVKYNETKGTGGDILTLKKCINTKKEQAGSVPAALASKPSDFNGIFKNPNHYKNATRNLKDLESGRIIKIHIWLVVEINGQKVKM